MSGFQVLVSESAKDAFYFLDEKTKNRMKRSFEALAENPFKKRSGADIKKLHGSFNPAFYRLRIGDYRAIYCVIEKEVKIPQLCQEAKGIIGWSKPRLEKHTNTRLIPVTEAKEMFKN